MTFHKRLLAWNAATHKGRRSAAEEVGGAALDTLQQTEETVDWRRCSVQVYLQILTEV